MKQRIMFNVNFKFVWTVCLLLVSMAISAQEICDNGIDDDGDALIDLNDDECDCSVVEPLTYINGSICRRLDLELEYPGATSFQWYKNGVAMLGETSDRLSVSRWDLNPAATYELYIVHPGGCVLSEPYEAEKNEYNTDLGEVSLCEGDTLIVAEFPFFKEGFQRFKTVASDGCDSTIVFVIKFVDPTTERINAIHCLGGTYINGGIIATEPGIYLDTIISNAGCDSLIRRVNLTFEEVEPVVSSDTACFGEVYSRGGQSITETGILEYISSTGQCDTTYQIHVTFGLKLEENIDETICDGGLYENGTISTTVPGDYTTIIQNDDGCDSIVNVSLTLDMLGEYRFQESICQGKIFERGDISTGEAGEHSYISTSGTCDSLIIIELSLDPPTQMVTDETTCQGKSVEWRGNTYDEEGTFTELEKTPGECDIEHVLNLTLNFESENIESQTICKGKSYTWRGNDYEDEGRYEELSEVPGECDILEVLELSVTPAPIEPRVETTCEGTPIEIDTFKIDESGTYMIPLEQPGECTVIYELEVIVFENTTGLVDSTLCNGDIFELYDLVATEPGSYIANTVNEFGCDSTIQVELKPGFLDPTILEEAICPGDFFTWYGNDYDVAGDYPVDLVADTGCDSIVILRLAIRDEIPVTYERTICDGESYILHDIEESTTGIYTTTVISGTGCDSLVTLDLKVLDPSSADATPVQICDGDIYTEWEGEDITEEGSYMTTIPNAVGCDSVITLTVTVLSEEPYSSTEEICEGDIFILGDQEAYEAGRYEHTFLSEAGCDSLVVIALQVNPLNQRVQEMKICPGDVVDFYGQELTEEGSYTERFTNENGCDSVVTYNIELNAALGDVLVQDTVLVNLGGSEDIAPIFVDESFVSFQWLDSEGNIMTLDQELLNYTPADDTYIEFLAVNEYGCEIRERVIIDVELIVEVFVPNVIQPDLDPVNGYFRLGGNESVVGIEELNIFDRWGELVFTDSHEGRLNSYIGWDGEYKGKTVLPGVYTYAAVFKIIDGSFVKKAGSVTVIR